MKNLVHLLSTTNSESFTRRIKDILPPYSVILHNDEVHSMGFVVSALLKSVSVLSSERAEAIMLEAHTEGRAIVISCPLEQAEFYRDRLRTYSLSITIEKA